MKNNKTLVLLAVFALLANTAFCAGVAEERVQQLNISPKFVKSLNSTLLTEKDKQQEAPAFERLTLKIDNIKKSFPDSANSISKVFEDIKDVISSANVSRIDDFVSQNLLTPLEQLSSDLIKLKEKDTIAFNATLGAINIKYKTNRGLYSIAEFVKKADSFLPSQVEVRDTEGILLSLQADNLRNVISRLTELEKQFPARTSEIVSVKKGLIEVLGQSSLTNGENASSLETLESNLNKLKKADSKLFDIVASVINCEYPIGTTTYSIADLVGKINEKFSDSQNILSDMTAYLK